jgi:hypothetical protein
MHDPLKRYVVPNWKNNFTGAGRLFCQQSLQFTKRPRFREEVFAKNYDPEIRSGEATVYRSAVAIAYGELKLVVPDLDVLPPDSVR